MIRNFCVLAALCGALQTQGLRDAMRHAYVPEFDETNIFKDFAHGTLGVYLNPKELHSLMTLV